MITKSINCVEGTRARSQQTIICPCGEMLLIRVTLLTTAGVPVDLSGQSICFGWDTSAGTTPHPAVTRVDGDATGIAELEIDTSALTATYYAYDVWLEDESYERTLLVERSFVRTIQPVGDLNIGPDITMAALAGTVPPGALAISGTATDVDGTLTAASFGVTVNGTAQTPTFTYSAGAWSASVTVVAGAASIIVTATDSLGATATATRTTTVVAP